MDKLLVVGVETVAGANLALALAERYEVLGLSRHLGLELDGVSTASFRPDDLAGLARSVAQIAPDWIVHCGPLSAGSWDLPVAGADWQCEPLLAASLYDSAAACGAHLTVVLTDAVFAGPRLFHDESSTTLALHSAAAAALQIEQRLADKRALLVRTHVYGWSPAGAEPSLAERMSAALAAGDAFPSDGRRYATPLLATDLAELLERAWRQDLQGLLHVAGAERTSPHRFGCELAAALGFPSPRTPLGVADGSACAPAAETSLNSRRARRTLECPMPMLREGLRRFADQNENGWRRRSRPLMPAQRARVHAA